MTPERLIIESLFMIVDKDKNDVPFLLNREQAELDASLTGRDCVPKARQLGISSYVLGRFLAACLSIRNTRAVVISHDEKSTQKMLAKVKYFIETIRGPQPVISTSNRNEVAFPKMNSTFYIGTAGAKKFGRGDTITHLHCSEIAFWTDPKDLTSGLYQAVPRNGEIIEESTGNGVGNYYHRRCRNAAEEVGRFRLHFFNWLNAPEYSVVLSEVERESMLNNLKPEWEEPQLLKYGLTLEQLTWRREKLEELDFDLNLFKQEYPISLDECFQASGAGIFHKINYEVDDDWQKIETNLYALKDHYDHPTSIYGMGVDVAAGVGRDRSTIEVVDLIRNEQVAEWCADNIAPDYLAIKINEIGRHFNKAFVTVESNNHGLTTLLELIKIYPNELIYSDKQDSDKLVNYGYRTTSKTKPIYIGFLRKDFVDGLVIHSPLLRDELGTFVEKDSGKMEAQEGCFDDRVIALAICGIGVAKAGYTVSQIAQKADVSAHLDPFSLEGMIESIKGTKRGGFPIPAQHASSQVH